MRKLSLIIVVLGVMLITSCDQALTPESYIKWVENPENGLCKSKMLGPVKYTVQYKTPEYIMLKNNNWEKMENNSEPGIHYFGLHLDPFDGETQLLYINLASQQEYMDRTQYFNFSFKNDIYLNVNGKPFPCEYYFFESTGNIEPGLTFTLGFDSHSEKGDIQLVINDRVFGNGGLNFLFKEKTLNNLPKLKTHS